MSLRIVFTYVPDFWDTIRSNKKYIKVTIHVVPNGQSVEVVSVVMHPSQPEDLVELVTEACKLTVTGSHRILIPTALGDDETLAWNMKPGDWMYCGKNCKIMAIDSSEYPGLKQCEFEIPY